MRNIDQLPNGTHKDDKIHGLQLKVNAASRRWQYYAWTNGRPLKRALGKWPDMSLSAARVAARMVAMEPPKAKQVPTLGELVEIYTAYMETMGRRSCRHYETSLRLNWEHLRNRPIDGITAAELSVHHGKIVRERGPHAGRTAITSLRTMFHHAIELEYILTNPAKRVKMVKVVSRDRVLSVEETKIFRNELKNWPQIVEDFFLLVLLTGLRRGNASGLKWAWVDLGDEDYPQWGGTITVPAEKSKNGEAITIPLCSEVMQILRRRSAMGGIHVFPGRSSSGCISEPYHWLLTIRQRVGFAFSIHDLRRTFATDMTERGAPQSVVAKALGHKSVHATPIYTRPSMDAVRKYLE